MRLSEDAERPATYSLEFQNTTYLWHNIVPAQVDRNVCGIS